MPEPLDSRRIVGLLADHTRQRVIAALMLSDEPMTAAQLAGRAGVSLREAIDAIDRLQPLLVAADAVDGADQAWIVDAEAFQRSARSEAAPVPPSDFPDEPDDVARVLDAAFADGRLVHFPTKRAKRRVVLDHLAQRFEIGQRYPEREVNDRLREVHDDVAMLRRWLVDEQFLDRSDGRYWRCGGSV